MFRIFTKLGGEEAALEIIAKAVGEKPSAEAIRGWKRLGRIPALNAVHLLDEYNRRAGWTGSSYQEDCIMSRKDDPSPQQAAE